MDNIWQEYEQYKKDLEEEGLPPEEYEKLLKEWCEKHDI